MTAARLLKALCLAFLVVIVVDIGFLVQADSLSAETCFKLAAMTAVAGLAPVGFGIYLMRATHNDRKEGT